MPGGRHGGYDHFNTVDQSNEYNYNPGSQYHTQSEDHSNMYDNDLFDHQEKSTHRNPFRTHDDVIDHNNLGSQYQSEYDSQQSNDFEQNHIPQHIPEQYNEDNNMFDSQELSTHHDP